MNSTPTKRGFNAHRETEPLSPDGRLRCSRFKVLRARENESGCAFVKQRLGRLWISGELIERANKLRTAGEESHLVDHRAYLSQESSEDVRYNQHNIARNGIVHTTPSSGVGRMEDHWRICDVIHFILDSVNKTCCLTIDP